MVDLATCRDRAEPGAPSLSVPRPSTSPDGRYVVELRAVRSTSTGSSASLAADGLDMRVVSAAGGPVHDLGIRLAYDDYLAWCGGRLIYTAGGDRIATTAKRLLVASPPDWRPRELVRDPARTWGSLACADNGHSVVVQSQAVSNDANFFHTHWSLRRVGLDGTQKQLTSPPSRFADEAPHPFGKTLYFVRSRKGRGTLYALRRGRLLGPFASLGYSLGYYGHNDWLYSISP
jgi:hypothetical protein